MARKKGLKHRATDFEIYIAKSMSFIYIRRGRGRLTRVFAMDVGPMTRAQEKTPIIGAKFA